MNDILTEVNHCSANAELSYSDCVWAASDVSRVLWNCTMNMRPMVESHARSSDKHKCIAESNISNHSAWVKFAELARKESAPDLAMNEVLRKIALNCIVGAHNDNTLCVTPDCLSPIGLSRKLFASRREDSLLRYYVMRSIRRAYDLNLSSQLMHYFVLLSRVLNSALEKQKPQRKGKYITIDRTIVNECLVSLRKDIEWSGVTGDDTDIAGECRLLVDCFLEVCRAVGFLISPRQIKRVPSQEGDEELLRYTRLAFRTEQVDGEYLMSHLFGMPTDISGLDQLFGGGGIVLPETVLANHHHSIPLNRGHIKARATVIVGRRGTGKSLLASQIAAEVAKRGGVAWLMALEELPEERLYAMESMNSIPDPSHVCVAASAESAAVALERVNDDRGAVIMLAPNTTNSTKGALDLFLESVSLTTKGLQSQNSLRVLIIDPINSRLVGKSENSAIDWRNIILNILREAKGNGTNIIFVIEEDNDHQPVDGISSNPRASGEFLFAEYLADTIIRLSVTHKHNYSPRYIEICKSRMQREQRGEHPISIVPGKGIQVFPSPAAVNARIRPRLRVSPTGQTLVKFGIKEVDDALGMGGISVGDIITFCGRGGSHKTAMALAFLLSSPHGFAGLAEDAVSLHFAARDSVESVWHMVSAENLNYMPTNGARRYAYLSHTAKHNNLRVVALPKGYVSPGYILWRIEEEINQVRLSGKHIHRIVVDNVAQWESSSPLVAEDATFGTTLIEYLRSAGITSLIICRDADGMGGSSLQRDILDNADCNVMFDRFDFRGLRRVEMRVVRTRGMKHRRESFEVVVENGRVCTRPSSSLLRVQRSDGSVQPVRIRLFLHEESRMQKEYNQSIRTAVSAVLSPNTKLDKQERLYVNRLLGIGEMSAVDELQIIQLDEYQIPRRRDSGNAEYFPLREFPGSRWDEGHWQNVLPELMSDRVRSPRGIKSAGGSLPFHAVPYIQNVGLLAYRKDSFPDGPPSEWRELARISWERKCGGENQSATFFDFPRGSAENGICLFLEILLSLEPVPRASDECIIRKWLSSESAAQALALYWQLSHRQKTFEDFSVDHSAAIWRHWYTTLNHMFWEMKSKDGDQRSNIEVCPLPGHICIAGEWYLGIPTYSAAPEAGLECLRLMTTPDAEMNRLRLGVGLPVRSDFYNGSNDSGGLVEYYASPHFRMNTALLGELIKHAFRRSDMGCYAQLSALLSTLLSREDISSTPKDCRSWEECLALLQNHARFALIQLVRALDYVQKNTVSGPHSPTQRCALCRQRFCQKRSLSPARE